MNRQIDRGKYPKPQRKVGREGSGEGWGMSCNKQNIHRSKYANPWEGDTTIITSFFNVHFSYIKLTLYFKFLNVSPVA